MTSAKIRLRSCKASVSNFNLRLFTPKTKPIFSAVVLKKTHAADVVS